MHMCITRVRKKEDIENTLSCTKIRNIKLNCYGSSSKPTAIEQNDYYYYYYIFLFYSVLEIGT